MPSSAKKGSAKQTAKLSTPRVRMWYDREPCRFASDMPSMTKQSFKDAVDINNIISTFIKTGEFNHLNHQQPNYGVAPATDFREALEIVQNAEDTFSQLPAEIRQTFDHDPAEFLAFVENPDNAAQLVEMGLAEAYPEPSTPAPNNPLNGSNEPNRASNEAQPNEPAVDNAPQDQHS